MPYRSIARLRGYFVHGLSHATFKPATGNLHIVVFFFVENYFPNLAESEFLFLCTFRVLKL